MQFLGNAPAYLGYVLKDDVVNRSVKNCKIFYRTDPDSNAGICVRNLAGEVLRLFEGVDVKREVVPDSVGGMKGFLRRLTKSLFTDDEIKKR